MKLVCNHCRIGRLHEIHVPYVREYEDQLLVIPNVPAGICDICDEVEYDMAFMSRLLCLLDPDFVGEPESSTESYPLPQDTSWPFL